VTQAQPAVPETPDQQVVREALGTQVQQEIVDRLAMLVKQVPPDLLATLGRVDQLDLREELAALVTLAYEDRRARPGALVRQVRAVIAVTLEILDRLVPWETPESPARLVIRVLQEQLEILVRQVREVALATPDPQALPEISDLMAIRVEQEILETQARPEIAESPDQLDRLAIMESLETRVLRGIEETRALLARLAHQVRQETWDSPVRQGLREIEESLGSVVLLVIRERQDLPVPQGTPDPEELRARRETLEKLADKVPPEIRDQLVLVETPEIRGSLAGLAQRVFGEPLDPPEIPATLARLVSQEIEALLVRPDLREIRAEPVQRVIKALQDRRAILARAVIEAIPVRQETLGTPDQPASPDHSEQDQPGQPAQPDPQEDRRVTQETPDQQEARVPPETQEILGRVEPTELREELAILVRRGFRAIQETPDQQALQAMWVLTALLDLLEKRAIADRPAREVIRAIRVEQVIRVRLATGALLDRPVTPETLAQLVRMEIPASRELAVRLEALEKRDRLDRVETQVQRATWAIRVQLAQLVLREKLDPLGRLGIEETLAALDQLVRSAVRGTPVLPEPPALRGTPEIRELREIQARLDQRARAKQVQRDRPVMLDPEVTRETPARPESVRPETPAQLVLRAASEKLVLQETLDRLATLETSAKLVPLVKQVRRDLRVLLEELAPPETPDQSDREGTQVIPDLQDRLEQAQRETRDRPDPQE